MKKVILSLFLVILSTCFFGMSISHATVSNGNNQVIYAGDGATTTFPFSFNVYNTNSENDLVIQKIVVSTGVVTTLALNTDYTVSLNGNIPNSGSVTLTSGALATGTNLSILRQLPLTQNVTESDNSATPASVRNNVYDRNIMISQQLNNLLSRSVIQNAFNTSTLAFPSPVANNLIGWNSSGTALVNTVGIPGPAGPQGAAGTGSGTVTSVTSANGDITVATTTTTPVVTLNSGTGASQIVKLTAASKLPAVDGSLLTSVNAATLGGVGIGTTGSSVVALNGSSKLPAVDGSLLTNIPGTFFVPSNIQVFTSSGTWTKPTNVSNAYVKVWGAGGGGGGRGGGGGTGSGGGGAGYSEGYTAVTGNVTVTVGTGGTGGDSSGSTTGTNGGTSSFAGSTTIQATGGAGAGTAGTGSNGQINFSGSIGNDPTGYGGWSYSGTLTPFPVSGGNGNTGMFYGSGGSGSNGNNSGGNGANGLVIVYY